MRMLGSVVAAMLALGAGAAQAADGNPVHGRQLFQQHCMNCHNAEKGGPNLVGPNLYGAFGRRAGLASNYNYSPNLKGSGVVWTPDRLNAWVQNPAALVPGVRMHLPPVSDPRERADLIAFLKVQSPHR
jgi:cytochrome c2